MNIEDMMKQYFKEDDIQQKYLLIKTIVKECPTKTKLFHYAKACRNMARLHKNDDEKAIQYHLEELNVYLKMEENNNESLFLKDIYKVMSKLYELYDKVGNVDEVGYYQVMLSQLKIPYLEKSLASAIWNSNVYALVDHFRRVYKIAMELVDEYYKIKAYDKGIKTCDVAIAYAKQLYLNIKEIQYYEMMIEARLKKANGYELNEEYRNAYCLYEDVEYKSIVNPFQQQHMLKKYRHLISLANRLNEETRVHHYQEEVQKLMDIKW